MAVYAGPDILTDGLLFYVDAGTSKSYSGSGTAWIDLSGNNNNGTLANSPTYTSGSNGYFTFDGTDDTMTTSIPITSTPALGNWSYEVWLTMTSFPTAVSPPNGSGVASKEGVVLGATYYSGAAIYWNGNSSGNGCNIFGFIRGADAYRNTSGFSVSLNTTYQFLLTNNYGGNSLRLYVNGFLHSSVGTATQEYNPSLIPSAGNIGISRSQIAGGGTGNYTPFPARIHLARVYNRTLSPTEVLSNFQALRGRYGL